MANTSDTLSITLKLGGRILPMTIKREEEKFYRDAEELFNQRFTYYANKYPSLGNELYLTMMALDIAVQLKRQEHESNLGELSKVLQELVGEIEVSLATK